MSGPDEEGELESVRGVVLVLVLVLVPRRVGWRRKRLWRLRMMIDCSIGRLLELLEAKL